MKAEVEIITVAQAKEYLERAAPNRPLSEAVALKYADDIRNDRWTNNGEGVIIGLSGRLLDGQHRCRAIILAQKPIAALVVRGVPDKAFETMGFGRPRSLKDVLATEGHVAVKNAVALSRAAYAYIAGANYAYTLTKAAQHAFIKLHPYAFDVAKAVQVPAKLLPPGPLDAVIFLANEDHKLDGEVAGFLTGISAGEGLWKGDPRLTLRNWVASRRTTFSGSRTLPPEAVFGAVARCWNAYASGKELEAVKLPPHVSRATMPIVGYDADLYPDVAAVIEQRDETRRSNLIAVSKSTQFKPKSAPAALP